MTDQSAPQTPPEPTGDGFDATSRSLPEPVAEEVTPGPPAPTPVSSPPTSSATASLASTEGSLPLAPPPPKNPIYRDTIEALTVAIIIALVIKHFSVEAYKVPSGSMEPAIIGHPTEGDRILVNKLVYMIRDPRRFDVAVFRYPNNTSINYIKRVCGLPEEVLIILGGDLYRAPPGSPGNQPAQLYARGQLEIVRKPTAVQDAMFELYPQIDTADRTDFEPRRFRQVWRIPNSPLPNRPEWMFENGAIRGRSADRSLLTFRDQIRDNRKFTPAGNNNLGGRHLVGDVRVRLGVRPVAAGGFVVLEILDPQHDIRLEARLAIGTDGPPGELRFNGRAVVTLDADRLVVGNSATVTFTNVDNRLELHVDDDLIASYDYKHQPPESRVAIRATQRVAFGVMNADVHFESTEVMRDIHYAGKGRSFFDIPAGHYVMLGDNVPSSKDSREWAKITITPPALGGRTVSGDTEAILDPRNLEERETNPWTDDAGREFFMDRFGNKIDITEGGYGEGIQRHPSPLVPRRLVIGRAMAVFLPVKRIKLIR